MCRHRLASMYSTLSIARDTRYVPHTARKNGLESSCVACPGGHVALAERQTACVTCPPGTSSTNPSVACVPCKDGQFSRAGATTCEDCPVPGTNTGEPNPAAWGGAVLFLTCAALLLHRYVDGRHTLLVRQPLSREWVLDGVWCCCRECDRHVGVHQVPTGSHVSRGRRRHAL